MGDLRQSIALVIVAALAATGGACQASCAPAAFTSVTLESDGGDRATIDSRGAVVHARAITTRLAVSGVGRSSAAIPLEHAPPRIVGAAVYREVARGIDEWWRTGSAGLEHGLSIRDRPAGEGQLTVDVAASGLRARALSDDAVTFVGETGGGGLSYAHLVVTDATGERVAARMGTFEGAARIHIDDARAVYPLMIDPLVTAEEATLSAADHAQNDGLGSAVALTADASRALLGAPGDDTSRGANAGTARVFSRSGTAWVAEATLSSSTGFADADFGTAVSISADGTRAIVGAPSSPLVGPGRATVFLRTGTSWTLEALLVPSSSASYFGDAVALSADGSRALVGARAAAPARVFVRAGTTWTEEAILSVPGPVETDRGAPALALSDDGTVALVGVLWADIGGVDTGSAHVFVRAGVSWVAEATLMAADGAAGDRFGRSVALASDGSRALVGADGDDAAAGSNVGNARVFLRTGTVWTEEATLLAAGGAAADSFGWSVALSTDGRRAMVGVPGDDTPRGADGGSARVFLRVGTTWSEEAALVPSASAFDAGLGRSVALSSSGNRALVGAPSDDVGTTSAGNLAGTARVFTLAAPLGASCVTAEDCIGGFCADGVCCDGACGGGTGDCLACSIAAGGTMDGRCLPMPSTRTCRSSTGACDPAESCTGADPACPADALEPATAVCRPSIGVCDLAERCTGSSVLCPSDALAPASMICRGAATPCDAAETCTGSGPDCPLLDSPAAPGAVCRVSVGGCDGAEVCDGVSFVCPGDGVLPAGAACGGTMLGSCSAAGMCNGSSRSCPGALPRPAGTVCAPAMPGNPCDLPDECDGTTDVCAVRFAGATTACGAVVSDVCDAPDHCSGTSADCVAEYLSGVECRAAAGTCDIAETCLGDSPACPPNAMLAAGVSCRPSTDTGCDPAEVCDGATTSCPADVSTCVPAVDAGVFVDAGSAADGGNFDGGRPSDDGGPAGADAGTPSASTGCACRVGPLRAAGLDAVLGAAIGLATLVRARRRKSSRRNR